MLQAIRDLGNTSIDATRLLAPAATEPTRRDDAERRQLTAMFTELVGSTALSTKLDLSGRLPAAPLCRLG